MEASDKSIHKNSTEHVTGWMSQTKSNTSECTHDFYYARNARSCDKCRKKDFPCSKCIYLACVGCDTVVLFENKCTSGHSLKWRVKRKSSSCSKCEIQETNLYFCTECPYYFVCLDCSSFEFPGDKCPNNHPLIPSSESVCIYCRTTFFGKGCEECKFAICSLSCFELRKKRNNKIRDGVKYYLTVAGKDKNVTVVDYVQQEEVLSLYCEEEIIKVVCDLHHGKIATGGASGVIRIWEVRKKILLGCLLGHSHSVEAILKINNDILASSSADKTIIIWNFNKFTQLEKYSFHSGVVSCLAKVNTFNFVSGSFDGMVCFWSISEKEPEFSFKAHSNCVSAVCYLGKRLIASGGWDSCVKIWDLESEERPMVLRGHEAKINCIVRWNKELVLSGSADCTVRVWSLESSQCIFIISTLKTRISCIRMLERDSIAICGDSTDIVIYDLVNQQFKKKVKTAKAWVNSIEIIKSF